MVKDTAEKKGFWNTWLGKTVSFVGKYTGISWLSKKVLSGLNSVKGWFSSSGATKAGAADSPASGVPSNDAGNPAPGLEKEQGLNQKDEVDPVDNGLSTTDSLAAGGPAEPTPSNGTSATSLSGSAGPNNGEKSFDMKKTTQNPVQSNPTPVGGMRATPQQGFKALIKIDGENLKFVSMTADTEDYIRGCKNPANGKECLVYVKHGEDMYRIIFTGDGKINSIAKQHKSTQHMNDNAINPNNNMESAKTLFGLNETAPRVEITEISNVPFEVPEVKSPKTPKKTTTGTSPVKPEMEKGSKDEKSANVREPSLTAAGPNVVDTGSSQGNPQGQGDSQDETVIAGPEVAPESPTPTPAPTSLVTEGSPQPEVSGAATVKSESEVEATETESIPPVIVVSDKAQGSVAGNHEPAVNDETKVPLEDVIDTPDGQEHGLKTSTGQDEASLSGGEEEEEDTKDVPVAPFEDGPKVASSASAPGESLEGEKPASGGAQLTEMDRKVEQHAPTNDKSSHK